MKVCSQAANEPTVPQVKKNKWQQLFKKRQLQKYSLKTEFIEEYIEFEYESDKLSQFTTDIQSNLHYFDFTFVH
jgi:effector-binding domain-containing protein